MCVICISEKGIRQPNRDEMSRMWTRNPHGAGYMVARDGKVEVHKGFMNLPEFIKAIEDEHFTSDDVVVYHFRISTQGGINPQMTQPFAFTNDIVKTKVLDATCKIGIAHNGIIPFTTDSTNKEYSDTAIFIAKYLPNLIRTVKDLNNIRVLDMIEELISSKMVFLDYEGNITTVGNFIYEDDGLIYSNTSYMGYEAYKKKEAAQYRFQFT